MTVTYTAKVATTSLACFLKLLLRWRGSIYKLLWKEVCMFIVAYYVLSFTYRFGLSENQKRIFEMVSRYCEAYNNLIPIGFVLGFYVTLVVSRWWEQFNKIPWPDRMALFVMANVHGHDERGRLMRRTIMRYLCLAHVITLSSISTAVKKRFPTFQHMTEAGFMNPNEEKIMEEMKTPHNKYFVPLVWTTSLVTRARKEGRIKDDFGVKTLVDEINEFRGMLGSLFNYDWISVPLVYTQVATIAVYMFVISCMMGRQFTHQPNTMKTDLYVPVFTFLQISFYIGWLKVAEVLVNPFGEDDDDFEMNWVIDRNLQVSYLIVDEMHQEHPELIKDQYWDEQDFEVPYTAAAEQFRVTTPHLGSAMDINVEPKEAEFVPLLSSIQENMRVSGNQNVSVEMDKMGPTDIPHRTRPQLAKSTSSTSQRHNPVWNYFKRSFSRDSRTTIQDSPRIIRPKRYRRFESNTTQATSPSGSPTASRMVSENSFYDYQDEIFNMDDVSDVWGGSGVSPTSERRGSDVRSTDSRVRGRRKQKERSPPVQPVLENKPLLPEHKESTVSKHSLWSSKSSLPSINESMGDGHKRNPSSSSASTTNTDEAYDTVKRAPPGVTVGGRTEPEANVAPDMTPAKIIVFERGKDGEKARLIIEPERKVETKPSSPSSADKNVLLRAQSQFTPKVTKDEKTAQAEKGAEYELDSEVRKSVSLHESLQRHDDGSKAGGLQPKHPKSLTNLDGPSDV